MINQHALSTADLARALNVDPRTIQRYVRAGTIPPPLQLSPRTRRWSPEVVQQFLLHGLPVQQMQHQGGTEHV